MVDIKEDKYQALLADFGLATILGGQNCVIQGSTILHGAFRWTAPELLAHGEPTIQSDLYSFGRVMFHVS
jgi:serine/threonine protein kinase